MVEPTPPTHAPEQPETPVPQVENDTLGVHDEQGGTRGGAPIPLAFLAMALLFGVGAVVVLIVLFAGGAGS